MNETWQLISTLPGTSQLIAENWLLAQAAAPTVVTPNFSTASRSDLQPLISNTTGTTR